MILFRSFKMINFSEISHLYVSGRGLYGPGTYFTPSFEVALSYTNEYGIKYIIEYELSANLKIIQDSDILNLGVIINPDRDKLSLRDNFEKELEGKSPRDLSNFYKDKNYDGFHLIGNFDGGEQVLIFPDSQVNLIPKKIYVKAYESVVYTEELESREIIYKKILGEILFSINYYEKDSLSELIFDP